MYLYTKGLCEGNMNWNFDFVRVPKEAWTELPLEDLAMKYDTVEEHGWYDNLIPTVQTILDTHSPEDLILDYSGGTGILVDRLVRDPRPSPNVLIVDSSPKFLRLALEKNKDNLKIGFRLIQYLESSVVSSSWKKCFPSRFMNEKQMDLCRPMPFTYIINCLKPFVHGKRR